ncbi:hypothetical protein [Pseudomonas viridiflava]|uniref:hypothetical protein n=1 Tax=Pseudomonas viridiflava TaxID=33069 RepID=UPI000F03E273|nr:hypothetical protein [Pseudomonas viridiflava]
MRGPYLKSISKLEALESILDECAKFKQKFKNVSALAQYCAMRINEKKGVVSKEYHGVDQSVLPMLVVLDKSMHYRSLLRKKSSYRRLLDLWMHSNCGTELSFEQVRIRELEHKLLRVGNELNKIRDLYENGLETAALSKDNSTQKNLVDDAFAIVEILLDRFSTDIVLEDGAVKERSVVRTVYVNAKLMKPYIDWLGKEL